MKGLTIHQPWAWAIAAGIKRIENRSRPTQFRGRLLIHAGLSRASMWAVEPELFGEGPFLANEIPSRSFAFGAIIGAVDVIGCEPLSQCRDERFASGPWCWLLANPIQFLPIPWRGALGLFDVPDHVILDLLSNVGTKR